jgi:Kef-type K+ transport system membrane component KefB
MAAAHDINEIIQYVFVDLAVVMIAARLVGRLAVRLGQPAVIGEIIAGLLLGPTALGALPGNPTVHLFPTDVRPFLSVLANLGLVLFMFIVGLELDLSFVKGRGRLAGAVSATSVALPFGLGALLATTLYHHHKVVGGKTVSFSSFALFLGVAMSITAFPVLARILADRGAHRTALGVISLACAAVDDVLAWTILAVVVAVTVGGDFTGVFKIILESVGFALGMYLIVRPLLAQLVRWRRRAGRLTPDMLAIVLAGVLLSSWVTEEIGIHFIFGAFLFGAVMPRKEAAQLTKEILESIERVSVLLLLPVFFVITGLGVDIGGIGGSGAWQLALILLVAIVGKFVGAASAARVQRVPRRQATALGILMNTRGLTELIILQVGKSLGVLDDKMFTMLVVMAVVTTMMTAPLLNVVYPNRLLERDIAEAEQAALGLVDAYTAVVVTDGRGRDPELVRLAAGLLGQESPARLVLVRIIPRAHSRLEVASGLGVELAQTAEATDELRRLSTVAVALGVDCTIQTQLGDEPRVDAAALAARAGADVVVAYADWAEGAAPWPMSLDASLVEVPVGWPEETVAVGALLDGSDHARAALRLATQLSLHRRVPLRVAAVGGLRAGRRAGGIVEALQRAGVTNATVVESDALADPALLVVASAEIDAGMSSHAPLRAFAGASDTDRDFEEVVERIAVAAPESSS